MKEEISVLCSADERYVRYCAVTILSVLLNTSVPDKVHLHLLSPDLTEDSALLLEDICDQFGAKFSYYSINLKLFDTLPIFHTHFSLNNYSRLYGPTLCEHCDRLLYLDCDTIVLADIIELFQYNLEGKTIGAVPHVDLPYEKNFLETFPVIGKDIYFNSGVMLIDAQCWREQKVTESILNLASNYADKFEFADQDPLNVFFWRKYLHLPGEWNVESRLYREKWLGIPQNDEVKNRMASPKIVHFTGSDKPWSSSKYVPMRSLYIHYSNKLTELTGWFPNQTEPKKASVASVARFISSCLYFRASLNTKKGMLCSFFDNQTVV